MREISVTGNLGADAEVLTDKNGSNYIRFRLGNHEFGDTENETRWFDVTMFNVPRILPFLKKGTGVRVIGDYKDSIYHSEKYGEQLNRNITAFKIDFWSNGKRDEGDQQNVAKTIEVKATETKSVNTVAEKPEPAKTAKPAKAQSAPVMAEGSDDELPF